MKKEIADLWVKALRSGEYKQGQMTLYDAQEQSYCCLGVLCRLHEQTTNAGKFIGYGTGPDTHPCASYVTEDDEGNTYEQTAVTPYPVMLWSGLLTSNGELPACDFEDCLTSRNDNGASFTEIADVIEANWESL